MKQFIGLTLMILMFLVASCGEEKVEKADEDTKAKVSVRDNKGLKIAYYVQDSLRTHFKYYQHEDSLITKKQLAFQNEVQRRTTEFQNFITRNDERARSGLLSQNEIAQIQQAVQQKEAELMNFQQNEGAKIEKETMNKLEIIGNKIDQFSTDYCEENNIDILFVHAKGGQLGYIHNSMDVTMEFMKFLNQKQEELEKDIKN